MTKADNSGRKLTRLTIYMLEERVKTKEDALSSKASLLSPINVSLDGGDASFYYSFSSQHEPGWLSFLKDGLKEDVRLQSSSASGLLLLESDSRIFAVTFGYGRFMLDVSKVEPRFGLMVCLNRIDPQKMRKLDTKAYEDLVTQTSTQLSKDSGLPIFDIDESRDILNGITGIPRDTEVFGRRLSGSESLVVSNNVELKDLKAFCHRLFEAFSDDSYKEQFSWVDQMSLVKDTSRIGELDNLVVENFKSRDTKHTYLAAPEVIAWNEVDSFTIEGTRGERYEDLDIDLYLEKQGHNLQNLTSEMLKRRKVFITYSRSGTEDMKWNLYKCIVSEQKVDDELFVLMSGQWFHVADSLVHRVDEFIERIDDLPVSLPKGNPGEIENEYNVRAAKESGGSVFVLDKTLYRPEGASSSVELCDLCTSDGYLIHVKRKTRSSTLSHLFSQGEVSAETLIGDRVFRQKVRESIRNNDGIDTENQEKLLKLFSENLSARDAAEFHVAYAVLDNTNRDLTAVDLPFFSKLNLLNIGRSISRRGFGLSLSVLGTKSELIDG